MGRRGLGAPGQNLSSWPRGGPTLTQELLPSLPLQAGHVEPTSAEDMMPFALLNPFACTLSRHLTQHTLAFSHSESEKEVGEK